MANDGLRAQVDKNYRREFRLAAIEIALLSRSG